MIPAPATPVPDDDRAICPFAVTQARREREKQQRRAAIRRAHKPASRRR